MVVVDVDGDPDRRQCAGVQDLTDDVPCPFLALTDDHRSRSDCIVIIPFRQQVCQIGRMMCRWICSDVVLMWQQMCQSLTVYG